MKVKPTKKVLYPSAELLVQPCFEDYKNELDSYNRIYDKVNISLAFCGVVLLVILDSIDLSCLRALSEADCPCPAMGELISLALSAASGIMIVIATIQMLRLMKGKRITIFNSIDFRNDHVYFHQPDRAALMLIESYTNCTFALRKTVEKKQKLYDKAVTNIMISLLLYALYLVISKGGVI